MRRCTVAVVSMPIPMALQCVAVAALAQASVNPTLEGRAVLPADTFAQGPPSGSDLGDKINGRMPPFDDQPVQGVSGVLGAMDGNRAYWAMCDNGYGTKQNSADFLLRMYRVRPDFETASGGSGDVSITGFVQLSDPNHYIPFELGNEATTHRLLTGADFDIESVQRDYRGDLWFGDEFGPFLLHTDAEGRLLEPPISLKGVVSPENPMLGLGEEATLPTSKGFEGMAVSEDGRHLYPMLEGALKDDKEGRRRLVYEFDVKSRRYTGKQWWYRTQRSENLIGDIATLDSNRFVVIERDDEEGMKARFKKIYLVDLNRVDAEGFLVKRELVDLLSIRDPNLISKPGRKGDVGLGDAFAYPFRNPESILLIGDGRLLVVNDNNYPMSTGRNPNLPDDTEMIIVRNRASHDVSAVQPATDHLSDTGGVPLLVVAGLVFVSMLMYGITLAVGR